MNNDLISREALKEAFADMREGYPIFSDTEMVSTKDIAKIIDNAPTVFSCNACKNMGNEQECVDCHDYSNYVHYAEYPFYQEAYQTGYDEGYAQGYIDGSTGADMKGGAK